MLHVLRRFADFLGAVFIVDRFSHWSGNRSPKGSCTCTSHCRHDIDNFETSRSWNLAGQSRTTPNTKTSRINRSYHRNFTELAEPGGLQLPNWPRMDHVERCALQCGFGLDVCDDPSGRHVGCLHFWLFRDQYTHIQDMTNRKIRKNTTYMRHAVQSDRWYHRVCDRREDAEEIKPEKRRMIWAPRNPPSKSWTETFFAFVTDPFQDNWNITW